MYATARRNHGVFEAESRLWQVVLMLSVWKGLNKLTMAYGADLQDVLHSNPVVHMRFRCARCSTPKPPFCWRTCDGVGNGHSRDHDEHRSSLCVPFHGRFGGKTKGVFSSDAYANDCFPKHQGEISALLNLARTLGGFSVAYFQVPWAIKHGALQTFGCEAAYVVCLTRPRISSSAILTSLMF